MKKLIKKTVLMLFGFAVLSSGQVLADSGPSLSLMLHKGEIQKQISGLESKQKAEIRNEYLRLFAQTKKDVHSELMLRFGDGAKKFWSDVNEVGMRGNLDDKTVAEIKVRLSNMQPDERYVYQYVFNKYCFTNGRVDQWISKSEFYRKHYGTFGLVALFTLSPCVVFSDIGYSSARTVKGALTVAAVASVVALGSFVASMARANGGNETHIRNTFADALTSDMDQFLNQMTSKRMPGVMLGAN